MDEQRNIAAEMLAARAERQRQEIKTIKPRPFTLELSDADMLSFYRLAAANGTTPAEILAGFIGDLIDGTYSHGSDERLFAEQYFERCCYELVAPYTFLLWAIRSGKDDFIIDLLDDRKTATEEIAYLNDHTEEATPENVKSWENDLQQIEQELRELYGEYCESCKRKQEQPEEYETGLAAVADYAVKIEELKGGANIDH